MNKYRPILILIIIALLIKIDFAEITQPRKSMDDLTNPKSPSFVPYPYPKTEKEVTADLLYAIKKDSNPNDFPKLIGGQALFQEVLPNLLDKNPKYKISKIIRERIVFPGYKNNYFWLIIITSPDGMEASRVTLEDTGILSIAGSRDISLKPRKILLNEDVVEKVSKASKKSILMGDIKKVEMVAYLPDMGTEIAPAWEISLKNGLVYYYEAERDKVFRIKKAHKWTKDSKGKREPWSKFAANEKMVTFDYLGDRIIIYEEVKE